MKEKYNALREVAEKFPFLSNTITDEITHLFSPTELCDMQYVIDNYDLKTDFFNVARPYVPRYYTSNWVEEEDIADKDGVVVDMAANTNVYSFKDPETTFLCNLFIGKHNVYYTLTSNKYYIPALKYLYRFLSEIETYRPHKLTLFADDIIKIIQSMLVYKTDEKELPVFFKEMDDAENRELLEKIIMLKDKAPCIYNRYTDLRITMKKTLDDILSLYDQKHIDVMKKILVQLPNFCKMTGVDDIASMKMSIVNIHNQTTNIESFKKKDDIDALAVQICKQIDTIDIDKVKQIVDENIINNPVVKDKASPDLKMTRVHGLLEKMINSMSSYLSARMLKLGETFIEYVTDPEWVTEKLNKDSVYKEHSATYEIRNFFSTIFKDEKIAYRLLDKYLDLLGKEKTGEAQCGKIILTYGDLNSIICRFIDTYTSEPKLYREYIEKQTDPFRIMFLVSVRMYSTDIYQISGSYGSSTRIETIIKRLLYKQSSRWSGLFQYHEKQSLINKYAAQQPFMYFINGNTDIYRKYDDATNSSITDVEFTTAYKYFAVFLYDFIKKNYDFAESIMNNIAAIISLRVGDITIISDNFSGEDIRKNVGIGGNYIGFNGLSVAERLCTICEENPQLHIQIDVDDQLIFFPELIIDRNKSSFMSVSSIVEQIINMPKTTFDILRPMFYDNFESDFNFTEIFKEEALSATKYQKKSYYGCYMNPAYPDKYHTDANRNIPSWISGYSSSIKPVPRIIEFYEIFYAMHPELSEGDRVLRSIEGLEYDSDLLNIF